MALSQTPSVLALTLAAILVSKCDAPAGEMPADLLVQIEGIVPTNMRVVAATNGMVNPVYRPPGKGIEILLLRKSLTLSATKGADVRIHLMVVPYDDGGVWTDDRQSQTSASRLIGTNAQWQVYVHGGDGALQDKLVMVLALTASKDSRVRGLAPNHVPEDTGRKLADPQH